MDKSDGPLKGKHMRNAYTKDFFWFCPNRQAVFGLGAPCCAQHQHIHN